MTTTTKGKPNKTDKPFIPEPTRKEIILPELERIRAEHQGMLTAESVITEAKNSTSPLHPYFEWRDNKAAAEYRLWQARQLINAMVVIIPSYRKPITAYVSLRNDRTFPGGGYRAIVDVMNDPELRKQLLNESLDDLRQWEMKYRRLDELSEIFGAIKSVKKKLSKHK
jgi:hypothetical protein